MSWWWSAGGERWYHSSPALRLPDYNRYRYYDPNAGRFISKDPIGLRGGINAYQFANGNPIKWIDPLGLTPEALDWSIVSKKGETRCAYVNKHGVNDLQKKDHGVFYGDPTSKINDAWNSKGSIQPINDGGVDVFHIPTPNSGYEVVTLDKGKISTTLP